MPNRVSIGVDLDIRVIEAPDSGHSAKVLRFNEHGVNGS